MRGGPRAGFLLLSTAMVIFVFSLAVTAWRIYDAERAADGSTGEDLVWSMNQNEIELLRLIDAVRRYGLGDPAADADTVLRRYDVLLSRFATFAEGELRDRLVPLPGPAAAIAAADAAVKALEPELLTLPSGTVAGRLGALLPALHEASVAAAHADLARLAASAAARQAALLSALAYLLGLVVSTAILVWLLLQESRRRKRLAEKAAAAGRIAALNEQRFRDIVKAASDWVWETDPEHRLSLVSEHLRELSGEEPAIVLGRTRFELRLPDDGDDSNWLQHRQVLERHEAFRDFMFPYLDSEGRRRWCRIHGRPVHDAAGGFQGYRGTGRDITAERRASQAVAESRELLQAVIDAVPAIINVKDRQSRYVMMNRFQGEVYGVDPAAAAGRLSLEFTGPEYGRQSGDFDRQVIETGSALPFIERDFVDVAGHKHTWWTTKQPLLDAQGKVRYVVTVALDITQLKASERARLNLSRYFSPNMVEVLAARDAPIGQVRQQDVAVVFADLVDFTRLSAVEPPARVMALLRDLLARLTDIVLSHGGTLEKFLGDGLMATFGTPSSSGRDACNALECTRAMTRAMQLWNSGRLAAGDSAVRIGIGAHYGPVILGEIGSDRRVEFAVVGDTVNVASRLEALTRRLGSTAVVSQALVDASHAETGGTPECLTDFVFAGPERIDGHDEPVRVWALDLAQLMSGGSAPPGQAEAV